MRRSNAMAVVLGHDGDRPPQRVQPDQGHVHAVDEHGAWGTAASQHFSNVIPRAAEGDRILWKHTGAMATTATT